MRIGYTRGCLAGTALALVLFAAGAGADVIRVNGATGSDGNSGGSWPAAKQTVGAAIAAAASGDMVWVAEGVYVENLELKSGVALYGGFAGSETDLSQRDFRAHQTVLDGGATSRVINVSDGAADTTRIDGFTIRNGRVGGDGAGIRVGFNAACLITNNLIERNTAVNSNNAGGGISINAGAAARVVENVIRNNVAQTAAGGAINCGTSSSQILRNRIVGNVAGWDGGGIAVYQAAPLIAGNVIAANSARRVERATGGGISLTGSTTARVINNTIVGNGALLAPYGGAIDIYDSDSNPTIANNIIAYNGSGVYRRSSSSTAVLSRNVFWANAYGDYRGISPGTGDQQADPGIADVWTWDTHLTPGSPCVDAGDPTAVDAGAMPTDIDGEERVIGTFVDVGADEVGVPHAPEILVRTIHVSPAGDDTDGLTWASAKRTVAAGLAAARPGDMVWVRAGTYAERITLPVGIRLLGGFAGSEGSAYLRCPTANVTVLDGELGGQVVVVSEGCGPNTLISGFTITRGTGQYGGGLFAYTTSPTISDNVFTACQSFGGGPSGGGAIRLYQYAAAVIVRNRFTGNTANHGSAILLDSAIDPLIINNLFAENAAEQGGAIKSWGTNASVCGNTFCDNDATPNNTGAAAYFVDSTILFANNIVNLNSSGVCAERTTMTTASNAYFVNTTYDWAGFTPSPTDIVENPILRDPPGGNYRLSDISPCIDTGTLVYAFLDATPTDLDGRPRVLGLNVDKGCYETDDGVGSLILSPNPVFGGRTTFGRVILTDPAPAGGAVLELVTDEGWVAQSPPTVTVPQGTVCAAWPITTNYVGGYVTPRISALQGIYSASDLLHVYPGAQTQVVVPDRAGTPGASVTLAADLKRTDTGEGLPGRTLSFSVDGSPVGLAVTTASGSASLVYAVPDGLSEGSYELAAHFGGETDLAPATGIGTLSITKANTSMSVLDRSGIITTVTALRAYLYRQPGSVALVGKSVTFRIDGTSVGTATTDATGRASLNWTIDCTPGAHTITGEFAGDGAYNGCAKDAALTATTVTTKVYVPARSGRIKQRAVLRAFLYTLANAAIPGKTLAVSVDGTLVGSKLTDSSGRVEFYYTVPEAAGAGARVIRGEWAGNAGYTASAANGTLTVTQGDLTIWVYVRSGKVGTSHPLKAYVRSLPDYVIQPGKAFTFRVNGTDVGSTTVAATGWAIVNWSIPVGEPTGAHTATAVFAGDAWYLAQTRDAAFNVVP